MNTAPKLMYDWGTVPWAKVLREVFKLQKRIYRASQRGDKRMMRKLQRLLYAKVRPNNYANNINANKNQDSSKPA